MLKKFISYYKKHSKLFIIDIISAFLMSGIDLIFPFFIQGMIDKHFPNRNFAVVTQFIFILLGLYIIRFILQHIVHHWGHVVGIRMETDMRHDLFSHLQTLPFKFYDNNKIGYLMSRITNDLLNISELAHHGPEDLFISSVMLLGSFIILFNMHWQLALFTFIMIPIMIFVSMKLGKKMHRNFKNVKEKLGLVSSKIEDSLSGIRVVKSFTNEEFEKESFKEINTNYCRSREKTMKTMADFYASMTFFSNLITLITLAAGAYFIKDNTLSPGQLVAFIFYVNMFMQPIRRLVSFNEQYQKGMAGFQRFTDLLAITTEIEEAPDAKLLNKAEGEIQYKNVGFGYDHHSKVLTGVNININAGETIAFVGPSGAGKSTLCKLLPRFYEIDHGEILIDQMNIKNFTLNSLRQNIGIVQQDVFLFNGTIKENIAYGKLDSSDEEIREAAQKANAHQFIMNLEYDYETNIGARGVKLSGGQKQRISIARSFLKNPPILILDEATSSLDNESEKIIQASLEKLSKGRTTLVIAHRLSTVQDADKIIVLTENGIAETGKHQELLNKNKGVYKNLYQSQFELS